MTESRGLRRSRPAGELAALLERAASLWAQGGPMSAMASQLGCTRSSLGGVISRHRRQGGTLFPPRSASNPHGGARRGQKPKRVETLVAEPQGSPLTAKSRLEAVMKPEAVDGRPRGRLGAPDGVLELQADASVRAEGGVSLIDLPHDGCRYPVSESGPMLFCGAQSEFGKSWCPTHAAIVRSVLGVSGAGSSRAIIDGPTPGAHPAQPLCGTRLTKLGRRRWTP